MYLRHKNVTKARKQELECLDHFVCTVKEPHERRREKMPNFGYLYRLRLCNF